MKDEQYLEFRAWDKVNKHMIVDSPLSMATIMGNYVGKKTDFNGKSLVENYEIMQFIGIRDKNEDKIYTGDLFRIIDDCEGLLIAEVRYDDLACHFYLDAHHPGKTGEGFAYPISECFMTLKNCIRVGNVYENPELLESDHE